MKFAPHVCVAYVDGSVDREGNASWGFVVYQNGKIIHEAYGMVDYKRLPEDAQHSRQVAGELMATMKAVEWAKKIGTKIAIVYDFDGIHKWVSGEWRTKRDITCHYKEFMQANAKCVDSWHWVKSHSGVDGNERADALAKKAVST